MHKILFSTSDGSFKTRLVLSDENPDAYTVPDGCALADDEPLVDRGWRWNGTAWEKGPKLLEQEAEKARRAALTTEEKADEDILTPIFDQASGGDRLLLKAAVLTLLDALNTERTARGALEITPAQLRDAIKTKAATLL